MKKSIHLLSIPVVACCLSCTSGKVLPPEPILPVPESKQVEWQQMETYAFIHFGLNTFNDREWGYGDTDPKTFNPTNLDCEQWAQTLVKAGMKGVILTAKHHDGFCLWPFEGTDYSVKNSPWKNGQGNVVKELSEACKKYGLKFAVYLSPWDRHQANYGTPEYLPYFYAQLHDLLTNYGPVFEVWFDGANGGDGWYGGAKDIRTIDRKNYYNYPRIYEMLDSIQPQAIIFSDGGPGCRWVGNEKGFAGATNWSFLRKGEVHPGYDKSYELQYGHPDGNQWVPAECDVSIRPGWFYHAEQDNQVRSLANLVNIYYRSVGCNSVLLLNIPPDKRGLMHENDVKRIKELTEYIKKTFADNKVEKGNRIWTAKVGDTKEYKVRKNTLVNTFLIQEDITKGQRVEGFTVEVFANGAWHHVGEGTTVGYKRLLPFSDSHAEKVRVTITGARGTVNISNIGLYYAEPLVDKTMKVTLSDVPVDGWKTVGMDAAAAIDGKQETVWKTETLTPLVVDMGKEVEIAGFSYAPAQEEDLTGTIYKYNFYVSRDGKDWMKCDATGEFSNIMHNPVPYFVRFGKTYPARYFKLEPVTEINNKAVTAVGEIGVLLK